MVPVTAARALLPIGLGMAFSLMGDATLYAVLPTHYTEAGIALGSVGIILSVNRVIRLVTNGPAGWLFDRVSNRRVLFLGSLWIGVLSTVIYSLSTGLPLLVIGRLLWGLAWSGIWIGGNGIVLQMAPSAQRGRWVGIYQVWFFFGSALGSFLGGILTDAAGYREGLAIGAAISGLGAVAALLALADHSPEADGTSAIARAARQSLPGWRPISPGMWLVAAAQGMNRLMMAGVLSATLGLVLQANFGSDLQLGSWQIGIASMTGGLLASRTLVSLVGAPLAGVWSDAAGHRWDLMTASLVAGALGIGLMAFPGGLAVIISTVISAAASGSIQSLATTLAGDLSEGKHHGTNLGLLYTSGDLGSAIGPLVAYAFIPSLGLGAIYVGCALSMLCVAVWSAVAGHSGQSSHA